MWGASTTHSLPALFSGVPVPPLASNMPILTNTTTDPVITLANDNLVSGLYPNCRFLQPHLPINPRQQHGNHLRVWHHWQLCSIERKFFSGTVLTKFLFRETIFLQILVRQK